MGEPSVAWTRVGDEVEYPRPPEGTADDDIDVRITSKRAQFLLCRLFDNAQLRYFMQRLTKQGATGDLRRLKELRGPNTDHQW
eukprot:1166121-Lingulodinium_polyedra.AAC.1